MVLGLNVAPYRVYLAAIILVLALWLRKSTVVFVFAVAKKLAGSQARWLQDLNRHVSTYVSWAVLILWIYLVLYLLDFTRYENTNIVVRFAVGVPVVLGTFALRRVITNVVVRHNRWDKQSQEDFARILMVTEGISACCYVLVLVEILLIYFGGFDDTDRVISMFLIVIEITLVLALYTSMKNIVAGLSLIFTDRFQIGSLCRIGYFIGKIENMSLRSTMLKQHDGSLICMPNAMFLDKYHQSLSARRLFEFEMHFRIDPSTKLSKIEHFMDTLQYALHPFVISDQVTRTNSSAHAAIGRRLMRSLSSFFEETPSAILVDDAPSPEPLLIVLSGVDKLDVRCIIRLDQDDSIAQAKSQLNLEILSVAQEQGIRLLRP